LARVPSLRALAATNEARDQAHNEARRDLAHNQQQSFDRLVRKEVDRADKWTSREFKQRSRDGDARDL
jgi:hypothetical protein